MSAGGEPPSMRRRRALQVGALATVAGVAGCSQLLATGETRYDADQSTTQPRWIAPIDALVGDRQRYDGDRFVDRPVVAGDCVYVPAQLREPRTGDGDGERTEIVCLGRETGEPGWTHELADGDVGTAVRTAAGMLYVQTLGQVTAFATGSHERRWSTDDRLGPVVDGTGYLSGHAAVRAVDARTGDERWTFATDGVSSAAAFDPGTVYVRGSGETGHGSIVRGLHAVDRASGEPRWYVDAGNEVAPTLAHEETVFAGRSGPAADDSATAALYAVGTDGTERWRLDEDVTTTQPLAVVDGTLVLDVDGEQLRGLDPATGEERWRVDGVTGWAAVDGGVLASDEDAVAVLDVADGTERWRSDLSVDDDSDALGAVSEVTVRTDTAYVWLEGSVVSLDLADGSERWRFVQQSSKAGFREPFAIVDDDLYLATREHVFALDA